MPTRPFSSINSNIVDQKFLTSTPASFNGQNVMLAQEQHQNCVNTLTTSVAGAPGPPVEYGYPYMQQNPTFRGYPMQPIAGNGPVPYQQQSPNAVTFTFNSPPQPHYYASNNPYQAFLSRTMPCYNQQQPYGPVNFMNQQQQYNQPYRTTLHANKQTSTSDLVAEVDTNNSSCTLDNCDKKKVTFCSNMEDAGVQCWTCCNICRQGKGSNTSLKTRKKRKEGSKDQLSELNTDANSDKR